jgi:hypothetical protein
MAFDRFKRALKNAREIVGEKRFTTNLRDTFSLRSPEHIRDQVDTRETSEGLDFMLNRGKPKNDFDQGVVRQPISEPGLLKKRKRQIDLAAGSDDE